MTNIHPLATVHPDVHLGENVTVEINTRLNIDENDYDNKNIIIKLAENKSLDQSAETRILGALNQKYPHVKFNLKESNSVDPVMGKEFFWGCLCPDIKNK